MDQKRRILIGTPCAGGQLTVQYMLSLIETFSRCVQIKEQIFIRNQLRAGASQGVLNQQQLQTLAQLEAQNLVEYDIGLYTLSNESLLSRGRNHIASVAIRQGWNDLFFIDADAQWSWDQFRAVVETPYDFRAGVCPLKVLPISLNYLPFQDDEFYHKNNMRSVDSLIAMREGHKTPHIPIAFVGTAFMCLSRKVLLAMAGYSDEYSYPSPATGHLQTVWDIFSARPFEGKYQSEDWAACQKARALGFEVVINADVIIKHVGSMVYSAEMANIQAKTVGEISTSNVRPA